MTDNQVTLKVPDHFVRHLGKLRQWIDGFEAAGGKGPVNKDTLRQIELWFDNYKRKGGADE